MPATSPEELVNLGKDKLEEQGLPRWPSNPRFARLVLLQPHAETVHERYFGGVL